MQRPSRALTKIDGQSNTYVQAIFDRTGMAKLDARASATVAFGDREIQAQAVLASVRNFGSYWVDCSLAVPAGTFASLARTVARSSLRLPSVAWQSLHDIEAVSISLVTSNGPFYSAARSRAFLPGTTLLGRVSVRPGSHLESALKIIADGSSATTVVSYDMELNVPGSQKINGGGNAGRMLSSSSAPSPITYTFHNAGWVRLVSAPYTSDSLTHCPISAPPHHTFASPSAQLPADTISSDRHAQECKTPRCA